MKTTEKEFNKSLILIKNQAEGLAQAIHAAGMFAIMQANGHGNTGFGERLVEAMGKKHDAQRVVTWLIAFGKFGVKKGKLIFRKRKDIGPENLDAWLEKADNCPYWEFTKQKELVERADYLSMLKSMLAKHKKMQQSAEQGKSVEERNVGVLNEVEKLIEKFSSNKDVVQVA